MDYISLRHVVGLTAHDRTSKLVYHPHRTAKVPTFSTQVQVGPRFLSCPRWLVYYAVTYFVNIQLLFNIGIFNSLLIQDNGFIF